MKKRSVMNNESFKRNEYSEIKKGYSLFPEIR
jgi:hypothetical protein